MCGGVWCPLAQGAGWESGCIGGHAMCLFGCRLPLAHMFIELGIGGEGPWLLVKERFDAAAEGGIVGCVVLDVLVD